MNMAHLYDFRLGATTAHNVLADLGWKYDASCFAATCRDTAMLDEVGRYTRSSFDSHYAWKGFRHALGYYD